MKDQKGNGPMNQRQNHRLLELAVVVFLALYLSACSRGGEDPGVEFMPYQDDYQSKPDFARLEYKHPLSVAQLEKITPAYLADLLQEQVDQIYARLTAGPIPNGAFEGELFFLRGSSGKLRAREIVGGGIKGLVVKYKARKLDQLGEVLWQGKVFYRDSGVLRNRIEDTKLLAPLIDGDLSSLRKIKYDGEDAWLLFPAKVFCGQSLLDSRRESIIIDYAFSDEIDGYRELPDFLAGRRGFRVRDEIRMIRPGFYLGRAYLGHTFILNFTLYNETMDKQGADSFRATDQVQEDCFTGTRYFAAASP